MNPLQEGVTPTPEYQTRVMREREELHARLQKLEAFIDGGLFRTLSEAEGALLVRQRLVMREYDEILQKRIVLFGDPHG